jgi:putative FmdB family regulatory protein
MPNVEFECTKCGNKFTMRRQFVDPDSEVRCPKCGTKHPKRVLNTFKSKLLYYFSPGAQEVNGASCGSCGG